MDSAQQNFGMQHRTQKYPNFHVGAVGVSAILQENHKELLTRKSISAQAPNIAYRYVQPSDLEILQEIHEALFPIKYETEFFMNVVHGKGIVAWAAVDTSRSDRHGDELVGFVTARMTKATEAEGEDILGYDIMKADRTLLYILTLGVVKPYRNFGIGIMISVLSWFDLSFLAASELVWHVIDYASRIPSCRAVYLHVIAYNETAILFYQKNSFRCLRRLSNFYHINGCYYDAYLYIYYVNGGRSPCSALDFLAAAGNLLKNTLTSIVARFYRHRDDRIKSKLVGP